MPRHTYLLGIIDGVMLVTMTSRRSAQKEPDVSYVLVYDNQGRIIHDGTADIAVYGQTMTDPLAYEAVNARGMHTQWSAQIVDVSEPIMIGSERIGGVRVGYSVASVRAYEEKAITAARERLNELGARHLGWIALLLYIAAALTDLLVSIVTREPNVSVSNEPNEDASSTSAKIDFSIFESFSSIK